MSMSNGLRRAAALHAQGNIAAARAEAEATLSTQPNDPVALQFAGVLCCQSGEIGRGAELLARAVALDPSDDIARLNLARALIDLGKLEEAEACCAPDGSKPPTRDLQRIHGEILKAQGRFGDAVDAYRQLVDAQPDDFESWNNLGNALHELGDSDGALAALDRARKIRPAASIVHLNLGRVLAGLGRDEDSLWMFGEAGRLAPGDSLPFLELGQTLNRLDRPAEALPYLGTAARLDPRNPEIFVAIGTSFTSLEERAQAEQAFRLAVKVAPGFAAGYVNLGIALEQANKLDELDALLRQAQAEGVAGGEIDYLRAVALRREGKLEEALALASSTAPGAVDAAVRAHFVGQVADRLDEVQTAVHAFEEMNLAAARSPSGAKFDGTEYAREVQRTTELTTPEFYAGWPKAAVPSEPPAPVFLLGFPRSGTTLLDTILMGHPGAHVLEELPILAHVEEGLGPFTGLAQIQEAEVASLRDRYFEKLRELSPPAAGALVIDKNPLAMLRAPLIHRLFPDAKIVFALRHPCDVVLSCFMQNFKVTKATASFLDLGNAARFYDSVMAYWQKCREIFPLDVHTLRYEAMVADTEAEIRPLLEFLGLAWDERILDHRRTAAERGYIRTPSYAQVTEGIYSRATGRWERYRQHIQPILPVLAPWVERFGYEALIETPEWSRHHDGLQPADR
ncbi:MAG TPA: sulfotransferase [Allosphingosinicella sp.]|jgi:tetratricopeptide (TPR) repeat protein